MADTTPATRQRLTALLSELQKEVDDSTPLGQMRHQRDSFALAWDAVWQDVLKNIAEVRNDYARMTRTLEKATDQGGADTERILTAIKGLRADIMTVLAELKAAHPARPKKFARWFGGSE
jgi:hypothetical protein